MAPELMAVITAVVAEMKRATTEEQQERRNAGDRTCAAVKAPQVRDRERQRDAGTVAHWECHGKKILSDEMETRL